MPAQDASGDTVGELAGFSLHAGVAARADESKKLERLCRPNNEGTIYVIFDHLDKQDTPPETDVLPA